MVFGVFLAVGGVAVLLVLHGTLWPPAAARSRPSGGSAGRSGSRSRSVGTQAVGSAGPRAAGSAWGKVMAEAARADAGPGAPGGADERRAPAGSDGRRAAGGSDERRATGGFEGRQAPGRSDGRRATAATDGRRAAGGSDGRQAPGRSDGRRAAAARSVTDLDAHRAARSRFATGADRTAGRAEPATTFPPRAGAVYGAPARRTEPDAAATAAPATGRRSAEWVPTGRRRAVGATYGPH